MKNSNYKIKILGKLGSILGAGILITAPIVTIESLTTSQTSNDLLSAASTTNATPVSNSDLTETSQPTTAVDETFLVPYSSGDGNLQYKILTEDTETHTGTVSVLGYTGAPPQGKLRLPTLIEHEGITYTMAEINANAFEKCDGITTLIIGSEISSDEKITTPLVIHPSAFKLCIKLKTIKFSERGTAGVYIYNYAFQQCQVLEDVTFPSTLIQIGDKAFENCHSLKSVSFPPSLRVIGAEAFSGCAKMTTITIPDSVASIGDKAFESCFVLKTVYMPQTPPAKLGTKIFGSTTFGTDIYRDTNMYLPSTTSTDLYNKLNSEIWPQSYRSYIIQTIPQPDALVINGPILVSIAYGTSSNELYSVSTKPIVSEYVSPVWSIEKQPTGDYFKIDRSTGELFIPDTTPINTYKITIKATVNSSQGPVSAVQDIIIEVKGVAVSGISVSGNPNINATFGTETTSNYTTSVLPTNATNKNVKWSLIGELANDKIHIDPLSGKLTIDNGTLMDTYKCTITATATDGSRVVGSLDVNINVIAPAAGGITIGGSDTLTTTFGVGITETYTAVINPPEASQNVEWALTGETAGSKIKIDQITGILSVATDLPIGTYNCNIEARSTDGSSITTSKSITIKVDNPLPTGITINGKKEITVEMGSPINESYTATITPTEASLNLKWTLASPTELISATQVGNNCTIKSESKTPVGKYPCMLTATTTLQSNNASNTIPVIVNITEKLATSVQIDGEDNIVTPFGVSTSSIYTATILPFYASKTVDWSIKGNFPNGAVTIDINGIVCVSSNLPLDQYDCTIIATTTDGSGKFAEKNITINITTPIAQGVEIQGKDKISARYGSDISENYTASVTPTPASQSVVWSLKNISSGNRVMIDPTSGKLSVPSDQAMGKYTCTVACTTQDGSELSAEKDVEIDITTPLAANITITGSSHLISEFGTATSANYTAVITPVQADQNVIWNLTGDTTGGKISINESGKVTVASDTPVGEYQVKIHATATDGSRKKAEYTIAITINTPSSADITINGKSTITTPYGTPVNTAYTAKVDPIGASQEVTWGINAPTAENKISIDSTTGNLSVAANAPIRIHTCTISATAKDGSGKIARKVVTVTISTPPTTEITILGKDAITSTFGVNSQEIYTTTITPIKASSNISWSLKQPVADNKILVGSTGNLTISNDTQIGLYTCVLVATATDGSHVSAEKTVTVNVIAPSPTNIIINGAINILTPYGTSVDKSYTAVVGPAGASQSIKWSLEGDTNGGKIKINPETGMLTVSEDTAIGYYECKIVATTNNSSVVNKKDFDVTVTKPVATSIGIVGVETINAERGIANSENYTAHINPIQASQSVVWTLLVDTSAMGQISLNSTGKLSIQNTIKIGSYTCHITAAATGLSNVKTTKDVTVVVSAPPASGVSISGNAENDAILGEEFSTSYKAWVAPYGADNVVVWSIIGENIPHGIKIDPVTGVLTIANDTPVGKLTCTINATTTNNATSITGSREIKINVIDPVKPDIPVNNDDTLAIIIGSTIGGVTLLGVVITAIVVGVKNHRMSKK